MRLAGLTTLEVERFQSWLLEQPTRNGTLTPATANHVVQALRSVTKWAIHQRVLRHDPFMGVEPLSSEPRRSGQLKSPKSGKSRLVPVPPELYAELRLVIAQCPYDFDCLVFCSSDPWRPISHHKIDDDFQRAPRVAGISKQERKERALCFHSWRRFANSWMVNQGVPLLKVQQLVGHTSLQVTENYLHQQSFDDVLVVQDQILN